MTETTRTIVEETPIQVGTGLETGQFEGVVKNVFFTESPYTDKETGEEITLRYANLEIMIECDDEDHPNHGASVEVGYPANITSRTDLGKTLKQFGISPRDMAGENVTLSDVFQDQKVRFLLEDDGEFIRVDRTSLGPAN